MTPTTRRLDQLEEGVGELLEAHGDGPDLERWSEYEDRPVAFIRDVLDGDPWEKQQEVARALRDEPMVTVRSCHAAGKDWLAARLSLWWVYACRGMVVLSGPTAAQVEEILMRGEIREAFRGADLPGELHVRALRPGGEGRAGIVAKTAVSTSALTGFHSDRVLFALTEAQDEDVSHAWEAGYAVTTGAEDRLLTLGNPTIPSGPFYDAHQSGSGWRSFRITAEDIPNVREGRTVVPGLLTREGVERFRQAFGQDSPQYKARVKAEFPEHAQEAAFKAEEIREAQRRHREGTFAEEARRTRLVCGVDVAGTGVDPDRTALCVRQGPVVRRFETWRGLDTRQSAARVNAAVRHLTRDVYPVKSVYVDTVGPGGPGVFDQLTDLISDFRYTWRDGKPSGSLDPGSLREGRIRVYEFKGSRKARDEDRYRSLKAQSFHMVRRMLERGEVALPDRKDLREELLAHRLRTASDGKMEVGGKEQVQNRLGHSPDLADSLVMTLRPQLASGGGTPAFYGK